MIFLYFAKYNGKLAVRNVFVCESFRDQVADRVLLGHCECINLFMFRDFFSSLLLNVVRAADENRDTAATVASGGLAMIPNPDSAVANVAEDKPAERNLGQQLNRGQ